ncbi:MAG TPA: type II toxin-antitoxin system PemK/MazF family toxin [Lacipirellulaceae bacterium]|nr:type II toxin-antitoxin system PemK/MazF family toxin [Lacipirellulaceae bacterium]
MTIIRPGEFWLADITFTNRASSKKRPVLVLWLEANAVVVAAVTSAAPRSARDIALADWSAAGLRLPSVVRLSYLDCLERSLLFARVGMISPTDAELVKQSWARHVRPNF